MYEEDDVDAALAHFEELRLQPRRLENAASRADERLVASFAQRDWDGVRDAMADEYCFDDRRRVVNIGILQGRDAVIATLQATTDPGFMVWTSDVIATRGEHLALSRLHWSGDDQTPEAFHTDILNITEIDADERIAWRAWFDADDVDAAFTELDVRYLAGEAAPYAETWSVFTDNYAALNRRELPPTTPDCVSIDHRRGAAFAPGELIAYARAGLDSDRNIRTYVEAVHRLTNVGASAPMSGRKPRRKASPPSGESPSSPRSKAISSAASRHSTR